MHLLHSCHRTSIRLFLVTYRCFCVRKLHVLLIKVVISDQGWRLSVKDIHAQIRDLKDLIHYAKRHFSDWISGWWYLPSWENELVIVDLPLCVCLLSSWVRSLRRHLQMDWSVVLLPIRKTIHWICNCIGSYVKKI